MIYKENTRRAYNNIAMQYYNEYKDDKADLEYIDKFLNMCNKKILDLGCGMGHYSKYIKNKGVEVVGVDFSKEMLKIAKENGPDIKFIKSDIRKLSRDLDKNLEQGFDGVLIAYVIHHLSKEETKECLINLKKYLVKNAKLLILFREGNRTLKEVEPFNPKFSYIIKEYEKKEITELLNECGYDVLEIEEKPYKEDKNSLCPRTLVLYGKIR